MNRTNKKGFTLVELLVVIAILAILATVSVVGYTAFIERATVSNDENVAAQLNQFLTAMKADSTGEFYNQTVTEENVWKVVDTALKQNGGISELEPQSLEYGYHYFFDITDQKFIVLKENDEGITKRGFKAMQGFGIPTSAADEEKPGFFKYNTKDAEGNAVQHTIFLIDTKGSSLAIAVRGFYTFEGIEPKEGKTVWETFTDALEDSKSQQNNIDYASKTIFVTKDGNKTTDDTTEKTNAVVHEGATSITTDNGADFSKVENDIVVPDSVKVITNDVLEDLSGEGKPSLVSGKTVEEIAGMLVEKNDGSANVTVKANVNDTTTTITITVESNKNKVSDGTNTVDGSFRNPVESVTINVNEFKDKVKLLEKKDENGKVVEKTVYVAWDYALNNEIKFIFEAKGEDHDIPASYENVSWKLGTSEASDSIKFTDKADQTVSIDVDGKSYSLTVKFVYLTGGKVKVNNSDKFELENDDQNGGNTDFVVTLNNLSQNTTVDGITLDTSFVLTTDSTKLAIDGAKFHLNGVKDLYDATHLNAKVGGYLDIGFDVKVYSESNLTFVATALANQIKYIGDINDITVGDLFVLNSDMTVPTNAVLWFGSNWDDDSTMPGAVEKKVTDPTKHTLVDETTNTSITTNEFTANKLRFKDGAKNPNESEQKTVDCYIVIPTNDGYRRISPVVTLKVVNAYNLKNSNIAEFEFTEDTTTSYHDFKWVFGYSLHYSEKCAPISDTTTSKSIVLLENVAWAANSNYYITFANGTGDVNGTQERWTGYGIYGNCFKFDVSGGRTNTISIINLGANGWLHDTVIVGPQYEEEWDPWSKTEEYACSAVENTAGTVAIGGANVTIDNCYISGGRAPVRIHGKNSLISNTVLFGGAFSNIDNQGVSFTLENVITVNQYDATHNAHIGGGIVISGDEKDIKNTKIQIKGTFTQYNFVAQNQTNYFANNGLKAGIGDFFTNSATRNRFVFTQNDTKYGNAGIIYDKNANSKLNDGTSNVDINVWMWDDTANDYVKKLPTGYGSAAITSTLSVTVKITAGSFDKTTDEAADLDVSSYLSQTVFYAPSLINTADHYQVTWQTTTTTTN